MAEVNSFTDQTLRSNTGLESLFHPLDPIPVILHQNSNQHLPLELTADGYVMERGPRYRAYAELREVKLREKSLMRRESKENQTPTPPMKKQVKCQADSGGGGRKGCSVLAQSVPDFSAALRKENRKAQLQLRTMTEMTPPANNWLKNSAIQSNSRGSKFASAGEKKVGKGGITTRKSYRNLEELKGLSFAAATGINGENRGGGRVGRTTGNYSVYKERYSFLNT